MNLIFLSLIGLALLVPCVTGQNNSTDCSVTSVCFALDQSGSIRSDYDEVREFTVRTSRTINRRTPQVLYSAHAFSSGTRLLQAPTRNLEGVFIPTIQNSAFLGGPTNIYGGTRACFDTLMQSTGTSIAGSVIIVVTDGEDTEGDPNPRSEIIKARVSIVTIGIGSSVDETFLRKLASSPEFFIPSTADNIVANAVSVANASCVVPITPPSPVTPSPPTMPPTVTTTTPPTTSPPSSSACQKAYDNCEFRFSSFPVTVPSFRLFSTPADASFTTRIVSQKNPAIGILNANEIIPEFIFPGGNAAPIYNYGSPRFTPTHFKPFPSGSRFTASGIGHQAFTGNQLIFAKNRCIRVHFSQFQTVDNSGPAPVIDNATARKSENKCVVFETV